MATEVVFLPGGVLEDEESGDTVFLPGGIVEENAAGGAQTDKTLNFAAVTTMALSKVTSRLINFGAVTSMALTKFPIRPKAINVGLTTSMALTTAKTTAKAISFGMTTSMALSTVFIAAGVAVNQSTPFGDLTLAGAGGFQLIDDNGDPLTGVTDDATGTASGYTLSAGGMITPTTDGSLSAEDTKTIDFSSDQGSATSTFSISAPGYHFRVKAELLSVITDGALAGGWTLTGRRDVYINDTTTEWLFENKTYTNPVVLTGETGFRFRNIIVAKVVRLTIRGIEIDASDGTFPDSHVLSIRGNCDELIIEDCKVHAVFRDPLADYTASGSYVNPVGIMTVSASGSSPLGITIQRCEVFDVADGIVVIWEAGAGLVCQDNEIHHVYEDFIKITPNVNALANGAIIQRNICRMIIGLGEDDDNPHMDILQIQAQASTLGLEFKNLVVRQNFAWEQTEARGRGMQGLASFGTMILKDPIFAGNVMVLSGNHHLTVVKGDGGIYTHNTLVQWETDGYSALAPRLKMDCVGSVLLRSNIYEGVNVLTGTATYTETDNLDIGDDGGTNAYSDVFDGSTFNPKTWTELKAKYPRADNDAADRTPFAATNIEDAGALGSGYQVVANVRDPTGWSFDSAYEIFGSQTDKTINFAALTAMVTTKATTPLAKAVSFVTAMVTTPTPIFPKSLAFAMVTSMGLVKQTKKALSVTFSTGMGIAREVRRTFTVAFNTAFALARKTLITKTVAFGTAMAGTAQAIFSQSIAVGFTTAMALAKTTHKALSVAFATSMAIARSVSVTKTVGFVTSMARTTVLQAFRSFSFSTITTMALATARVKTKAISVAFVTAFTTVANIVVSRRIIWLLRRRRR